MPLMSAWMFAPPARLHRGLWGGLGRFSRASRIPGPAAADPLLVSIAKPAARSRPSRLRSARARAHRAGIPSAPGAIGLGLPWLASLLLLLPAWANPAGTRIEVAINGMVCSFCAQGVERKLGKMAATESVKVDLNQRLVSITLRPGGEIADDRLRSLIRDAGFDVRQIRRLPPSP